MDKDCSHDIKPLCSSHSSLLLNTTPRKPLEELATQPRNSDDNRAGEEAITSTTAPQTPSLCKATDAVLHGSSRTSSGSDELSPVPQGELIRQHKGLSSVGSERGAKTTRERVRIYKDMLNHRPQQTPMPCNEEKPCELHREFPHPNANASEHLNLRNMSGGAPACGNASPIVSRSEASEAESRVIAEHPSANVERIQCAMKSSACISAGSTCLQQLLEQYRNRRSVFERNCLLRYESVFEVAIQGRQASGLWGLGATGQNTAHGCRLSAALRKGHEGNAAKLTSSSSGEEATSHGTGDTGKTSTACGDGEAKISEGRLLRRPKGTGQRSFPYRQFHVHHFLPEPENKVGLLTHPTPAQFNKYPKARGVWFDPHRNLVRTCWKENGKARTMGFPVNKFGLEEARTLAVEYHYYKCPTDPLPDDLSSLIPRKPPHAYGWC